MDKNITLMKIESYMKQRNWTVYRLAKESDISYSSLNNLFQRNTEPTLPTLRKICSGLGISLSQFFSDEQTPPDLMFSHYSLEDRILISLYHSLKGSDKKLLMTYAQALNWELPK